MDLTSAGNAILALECPNRFSAARLADVPRFCHSRVRLLQFLTNYAAAHMPHVA
jgi:hypothetical protein